MAKTEKKNNFALILVVYLLGIFMGALDTGIVTPARTVIQESLGVSDNAGIWMITIYTLAYAASIPVMGKLADRIGRRTIYLIAILLFGAGSFLCGVSHYMNSFSMLLISRAIQAIGGGGIMPVATAEFGTTFPEEKRGMALGLVGGVYGIANIFGASAGSLVMDIFGTDHWEFIFYVNVPIAIFILIAGFFSLPNTKDKSSLPIDGAGTCILVVMILSLMYGLKNIDFFNFVESISDPGVYWFLIGFLVLLPLFVFVEKKAADPVMNLKYFSNIKIVMTLCVSIITGIVLMGIIFIPQFCENALMVSSGKGGYFVILLGVCAGVGAMGSGKLTDKFGPKLVLACGFVAAIIGSLIIIFLSSQNPNKLNVFASLIFIGLGIGFTMGAPLNYMMLGEVDEKEANSALATLSLVRSLGTVVAPAIMVGFITHAAAGMSDSLMAMMPEEINVPELPYASELTQAMKDSGMGDDMPSLDEMTSIKIDMANMDTDSDIEIPDELLSELQSSDVTTITGVMKDMASFFFDEMSPEMMEKINGGIDEGMDGINSGISEMDAAVAKMKEAISGMQQGIDGMAMALSQQKAEQDKMKGQRDQMQQAVDGMKKGLPGIEMANKMAQMGYEQAKAASEQAAAASEQATADYNTKTNTYNEAKSAFDNADPSDPEYENLRKAMEDAESAMNTAKTAADNAAAAAGQAKQAEMQAYGQAQGTQAALDKMNENVNGMESAISGISKGIDGIGQGMSSVKSKRQQLISAQSQMKSAIDGINSGKQEMYETLRKMNVLKEAVPGAFKDAEKNYLKAIDKKDAEIKACYQSTLNVGFRQIFILTGIGSAVGIILLLLCRTRKKDTVEA